VVFSPFYHYGMYSAVMNPEKKYSVTEISVNGKLLQTKDFSPYVWDKINLPVQLYHTQDKWNQILWLQDISRLLHATDSSKYLNQITATGFSNWYRTYLQNVLHQSVDTVSIQWRDYVFDGKALNPLSNK
jgi:hypothetical protein